MNGGSLTLGTPREFGLMIVEGLTKLKHDKIIASWGGEGFTPAAFNIHGDDVVIGLGFIVMEFGVIRAPVHRGPRGRGRDGPSCWGVTPVEVPGTGLTGEEMDAADEGVGERPPDVVQHHVAYGGDEDVVLRPVDWP